MRKNARKFNQNILDARNEFNFRKILFMILKNLVKTPKKHIGYFIPQTFNNQNKITSTTPLLNVFQSNKKIPNLNILKEVINNQDYKDVEHAMKEFHHYVDFAIHKKFTYDQEKFQAKETCFFWLAKILVIGTENTNIIGYPYNISLYHSVDQNSKDYFSPLVWNIILNGSNYLGKDYFNHNVILYKIFNSNLLQKTKRENFLVIQSILLFFEHVLWSSQSFNLLNDDYKFLNDMYQEHFDKQKPIKPKVKLLSKQIIEEKKDNIEKIISQREKDIEKFIPKPPQFNMELIKKYENKKSPKSKKSKKSKKNKKEDEEEYFLPDVFYNFELPSINDKKIINNIKKNKNTIQIPIVKPIVLLSDKKSKKNSGIQFNILKTN
jgi:hypothetical protein